MRDWKTAAEERRNAEIEAGKRALKLYPHMERLNEGTRIAKEKFPTLDIATVINSPYSHVTVRVRRAIKLAPLNDLAVLEDSDLNEQEWFYEEPIENYPSDHFIAQLMLIS